MAGRMKVTRSMSLALAVSLVSGLVALVCLSPLVPADAGYHAGERAPRTLEAVHGAQFESTAGTELARQNAADAVAPVYLQPDVAKKRAQLAALETMFNSVRSIRGQVDSKAVSRQVALGSMASTPGLDILSSSTHSALLSLSDTDFDQLRSQVEAALGAIMDNGITDTATLPNGTGVSAPSKAEIIAAYMRDNPPGAQQATVEDILDAYLVPNKFVDEAATEQNRSKARADVKPVIRTYTKGQVVVSENAILTEQDIENLRQTGVLSDQVDFYGVGAAAVVALGFAFLVGCAIHLTGALTVPMDRRAIVFGAVIALALAGVRIAAPVLLPDTESQFLMFAIPVAAAPMVVAAFSNASMGAIVAGAMGLVAAFIAATVPDIAGATFSGSLQSLELAVVFAATGVAGSFAMHRVDRISRFSVAAVVVSLSAIAALGAFWLLDINRETDQLAWMALAGGINGIGSTVIAAGGFVFLASALGIPTRLQLMEIADSGHPLQRRLREEAPGTYHHSMMVGALAERAADRIGADVLLAKVGAYYHDTGKLSNPAYYIENMLDGGVSPHDSMSPAECADIIKNHVTAGVQIARRYHLPVAVRAFIPEHHGTRLVTYFYRKAAESGDQPDIARFQYAGPKPQTRESAIVMLADSCEALARAKQQSGDAIDVIVDGVVAERLAEGQLDECDITLRELQEVAKSFKSTLKAVYHPRIEYPPALPDEVVALATGTSPGGG